MSDFRCPECGRTLIEESRTGFYCRNDRLSFEQVNGIWRFLAPGQQAALARFLEDYETIRAAEDRAGPDDAFYRALPFRDTTGRQADMWRIRAASYRVFDRRFLSAVRGRALRAADLGAGNGWLAYRLALRGHKVDAVDLLTNDWDGLGCRSRYDRDFRAVQASFDALPYGSETFDLVVFNASLHYSTGYAQTLAHVLERLKPGGTIAVIDTPFYRAEETGRQMVAEREAAFTARYGFPSNALAMENFLTYRRLEELAARLNLQTRLHHPAMRLARRMAPLRARLAGRRPPAAFPLVLLQRRKDHDSAKTS